MEDEEEANYTTEVGYTESARVLRRRGGGTDMPQLSSCRSLFLANPTEGFERGHCRGSNFVTTRPPVSLFSNHQGMNSSNFFIRTK